jgi:pyrroloquinoline quinone (PQQ) biosynthesis protein C
MVKQMSSPEIDRAKPIDDFMAEIDSIIEANKARNDVYKAIQSGNASRDVVKRIALEFYWMGVWYTPEFGLLYSNAPDAYELQRESSQHYKHWWHNLADETGLAGDPDHVEMKVELCHLLGITDEEMTGYVPLPETIGSVFTALYFIRRGYEEGLAAFGYAGEKVAADSGYAVQLYEGLKQHYGVDARNFYVHAYAEEEHGALAESLMRQLAVTHSVQQRMRRAVLYTSTARAQRIRALNRLLEA